MEEKERKKIPPVDHTNDYIMVTTGLRPPKLRKEVIERNTLTEIKKAKKAFQKLKSDKEAYTFSKNEIIKAFLGSPLPMWGNLVFVV